MRFRLLGLVLLAAVACRKADNPKPKLAPVARFFVDSIGLSGMDRLPSRFKLAWSGDDPDGYVVGYELRKDGGPWAFTTAQESTFVVTFETGEVEKDITFELRALDNDGLRTEPPVRLQVPLRNTPPTCYIDAVVRLPDTTFPVLTVSLQVDDLDGSETLDSLYVRIGPNSPWRALSPRNTLLSFVSDNPRAVSPTRIYGGTSLTPILTIPEALPLSDTVRLYFRAKDNGNLFSEVDSTKPIYIRPQASDWLVLDGWGDASALANLDPDFTAAWGSYDHWNLRQVGNLHPLYNPTWIHLFRLYPRIFWLTDQGGFSRLEEVEQVIQTYLNSGGRLFICSQILSTISTFSPIFRWGPMDSISSSVQNGLLAPNAVVAAQEPAFPDLRNGLPYFMSLINPPYVKGTARVLYEMPTLQTGTGQSWPNGFPKSAVLGFPEGTTPGKYRQIFCILPLHQLGGDRIGFLQAVQTAFQP